MADDYDQHHVHVFLPRLAAAMPQLAASVDVEARPDDGRVTEQWLRGLSPRKRLEVCRHWVRAAIKLLHDNEPAMHHDLALAMLLQGEFTAEDFAAIAWDGEPDAGRAVPLLTSLCARGLLVPSQVRRLYCVPYPLRMVFENESLVEPERLDVTERRLIAHEAAVATALEEIPATPNKAGWRFANLLGAWETAARRLAARKDSPAGDEDEALVTFAERLGPAVSRRASDDGAQLFEASAQAAARLGRVGTQEKFLFALGKFWMDRRNSPLALDAFGRCVELCRASGDLDLLSRACSARALLLGGTGEIDKAMKCFHSASDAATTTGHPEQAREIARCAASMLLGAGRAEEAQAWLGGVGQRAEELMLLARAFEAQDRVPEAREQMIAARDAAHEANEAALEARASLALAALDRKRHSFAEARVWGRAAEEIYTRLGDTPNRAAALLEIARAARASGEDSEAASALAGALKCALDEKDAKLAAELHEEYAEHLARRGDVHRAAAVLRQALDDLRTSGEGTSLARLHLRLAELFAGETDAAVAMMEALRAQGILRSLGTSQSTGEADALINKLRPRVLDRDFDALVARVSEELESDRLLPARMRPDRRAKHGG